MKIQKLLRKKKAVSPVIATLLMIAIAVGAAILVYVWSMGLIGSLQTGGGQQVREQVIMEAYAWNGTTLDLYLRNVGNAEVEVDNVYVAGSLEGATLGVTLNVLGPSTHVPITTAGSYTAGVAYTVKIVTKTGGVFTFSCVYGSAG